MTRSGDSGGAGGGDDDGKSICGDGIFFPKLQLVKLYRRFVILIVESFHFIVLVINSLSLITVIKKSRLKYLLTSRSFFLLILINSLISLKIICTIFYFWYYFIVHIIEFFVKAHFCYHQFTCIDVEHQFHLARIIYITNLAVYVYRMEARIFYYHYFRRLTPGANVESRRKNDWIYSVAAFHIFVLLTRHSRVLSLSFSLFLDIRLHLVIFRAYSMFRSTAPYIALSFSLLCAHTHELASTLSSPPYRIFLLLFLSTFSYYALPKAGAQ